VFGRSKNNNDDDASMNVEPVSTTPGGKKGRPTPKRKAAEAARIRPLVPKDRKEAKRAARAARNARFDAEQRAMITGEEKYLPARDKGRARRFVRDYVDARHSFSEWILAVMMVSIILIMMLSMLGNKIPLQYQAYMLYGSSILMYGSFIVTAIEAFFVWRTIKAEPKPVEQGFWEDFRSGLAYFARNRGIVVLMLLVTLMTFCMGFLQTLLTPMMLDLADEQTLGLVRSVAAIGMVVASLAIGVFNMGNNHIRYLAIALAFGGVVVIGLGMTTDVVLIGVATFLFFMVLPPLNTSVEVLTRSWIPNETQGKIWGLMGLVSQLGFLVAYCIAGPLADAVFNPLLRPGGALVDGLGGIIGVGQSRGIGLMFGFVGILLILIAVITPRVRAIRVLEDNLKEQLATSQGSGETEIVLEDLRVEV